MSCFTMFSQMLVHMSSGDMKKVELENKKKRKKHPSSDVIPIYIYIYIYMHFQSPGFSFGRNGSFKLPCLYSSKPLFLEFSFIDKDLKVVVVSCITSKCPIIVYKQKALN